MVAAVASYILGFYVQKINIGQVSIKWMSGTGKKNSLRYCPYHWYATRVIE